ncbi:hypothetical protein [Sphingorhabdus sp. EL138]|uniref:hypothetical protein n=1 Tax=Sphingorhabdus sp. EL138 TaxID=2073156 RepID=UPI0020B13A03|nr:hypothetical protein [Sphingorhabdus sp. EL138]
MTAEQMISFPTAKFIACQVTLALQKIKLIMRDEQMQKACARTNRAIAIEHVRLCLSLRSEPHGTTMATASDVNHGCTRVS